MGSYECRVCGSAQEAERQAADDGHVFGACGRGFEIGFDFGFQGRLIALQRQQKIGFVPDDLAAIST